MPGAFFACEKVEASRNCASTGASASAQSGATSSVQRPGGQVREVGARVRGPQLEQGVESRRKPHSTARPDSSPAAGPFLRPAE